MFTKNKVQISTYMVLLIPFVLLGIFASGLFSFPDLTLMNIGDKVMYLLYHIWEYKRFFNEKTMMCIGWSVILWVFLCSYIMYHFRDFHSDIQNGSEEWADPYEVTKRRANPDDSKNRILSQHVKVDTQGDRKPSNNNMLVIGSAGTYKTTSVVARNLLKAQNNIIALDVKGELMFKYGLYLKQQGYTVRCLNLKNPEMSDRYNPFAYIENEEDLIKQASEFAGSIPVKKLLPYWKTANRYLFCGGSVNMRDAAVYARDKQWNTAIGLWKQTYATQKGKKKMQAAYNLAVGYEMQDSIAAALDWALKAQAEARIVDGVDKKDLTHLGKADLPYYVLTTLYATELKERKEGLSRLNMQMQRFNNDF